jgi:hypothetical protein
MQSWAVATTDKPKQKSGRPRGLIRRARPRAGDDPSALTRLAIAVVAGRSRSCSSSVNGAHYAGSRSEIKLADPKLCVDSDQIASAQSDTGARLTARSPFSGPAGS